MPELARSWAERVPEGFWFDVKAYGLLTGHPVETVSLWPDIRGEYTPRPPANGEFNRTICRLMRSKRRGHASSMPLAPCTTAATWGRCSCSTRPGSCPSSRTVMSFAPARTPGGMPACVEFRSPAWFEEKDRARTLGLLRDLGLAIVVVDAPKTSGLPTVLKRQSATSRWSVSMAGETAPGVLAT